MDITEIKTNDLLELAKEINKEIKSRKKVTTSKKVDIDTYIANNNISLNIKDYLTSEEASALITIFPVCPIKAYQIAEKFIALKEDLKNEGNIRDRKFIYCSSIEDKPLKIYKKNLSKCSWDYLITNHAVFTSFEDWVIAHKILKPLKNDAFKNK